VTRTGKPKTDQKSGTPQAGAKPACGVLFCADESETAPGRQAAGRAAERKKPAGMRIPKNKRECTKIRFDIANSS
jgi:hypothetical protein